MKGLPESLLAGESSGNNEKLKAYLGSDKEVSGETVPEMRKKVSAWLKANKNLDVTDWKKLIKDLFNRNDYQSIFNAGILLDYSADCRAAISKDELYEYTGKLHGWAEVDSFSYGHYSAREILADKKAWADFLKKLANSDEVSRQRAAIVYLCKPISKSDDPFFADQAEYLIGKLLSSKDKLITKAISWLIRSMVKLHKDKAEQICDAHMHALPAFVLKEVGNKLQFGTKTARKS